MYFSIGKINNIIMKNSSFCSLQYDLQHINMYTSYIDRINTRKILKSIYLIVKNGKDEIIFQNNYAILVQQVNLHIIKRKNRVGHRIDQKI